MSKEIIELIELLNKGYTNNQICSKLNLTNSQLYTKLKNLKSKGLSFIPKYYSSGEISFYLPNDLDMLIKQEQKDYSVLITKPKESELRFVAMSDLHYGNSEEKPHLVNEVYEYCKKNGIHIVTLCGDMIDGTYTRGTQKEPNVYNQMNNFIKNYPQDNYILNFGVGGDHDYSAFSQTGQNFLTWLKEARKDIIVPAYNNTNLFVKNDKIVLYHKCNDNGLPNCSTLLLRGHNHKYLVRRENDIKVLNIYVPPLATIGQPFSSFLDVTVAFKNGLIEDVYIKQLVFLENEPITIGETSLEGIKNPTYIPRNITQGSYGIMNEQNYGLLEDNNNVVKEAEPSQPKTLRKESPLSQIEKFNKRWGR